MNDRQTVPGWWLASDGKWYPPSAQPPTTPVATATSAPDPLAGAAPPPSPPAPPATVPPPPAGAWAQPASPGAPVPPSASAPPPGAAPPPPGTNTEAVPAWATGAGSDWQAAAVPTYVADDTFAVTAAGGPRKHRRLWPLGVVAVVVLALAAGGVVVFGLGSSNDGASAAVTKAADAALAAKTAHLSFTLSGSFSGSASQALGAAGAGAVVQGSGSGQADFANNAAQMTLQLGAGAQNLSLDVVLVNGTVYESSPSLAALSGGKPWVAEPVGGSLAGGGLGLAGQDPADMLHVLAQNGATVTPTGSSTVDGVPVQTYQVAISPQVFQNELNQANVPSWAKALAGSVSASGTDTVAIDQQGNLRRVVSTVNEQVFGQTITMNFTMDLTDLGAPVTITPPPPDQVTTLSPSSGTPNGNGSSPF